MFLSRETYKAFEFFKNIESIHIAKYILKQCRLGALLKGTIAVSYLEVHKHKYHK